MKIRNKKLGNYIILYGGLFKLEMLYYGFSDLNRIINKRRKKSIYFIKKHIKSGKLFSNIKIIDKDTIEIKIYYKQVSKRHRTLKETEFYDYIRFKYQGFFKYKSKNYKKIMEDNNIQIDNNN